MGYLSLKMLHLLAAIASLSGFVLRGYWMMVKSDRLQLKAVRILPHVVDTVFLLSGIALIAVLDVGAISQPWLLAKFAGLIVYIVLGSVAIKRGSTLQKRVTAFIAALAVFAYIIGVALSKSPASWLAVATI